MKPAIERVVLERQELERLLEHARPALSEEQYRHLKAALDTLVYLTQWVQNKNTTIARLRQILFGASSEKIAQVLKAVSAAATPQGASQPAAPATQPEGAPAREGHGRNAAQAYAGATTIKVEHPSMKSGQLCPECRRGELYPAAAPGVLVRVMGQAPLNATVYELEKLRCNLCLQVFTAQAPVGVGAEKYDAGAASMIALLKYGSGLPFNRLEQLQQSLGMPLPASTRWEIVEKSAALVKPAFEELIGQAAQGEVVHNDDTTMKILAQMGEGSSSEQSTEQPETARPQRTGIFTSGIVSTREGRTIRAVLHRPKPCRRELGHGARATGRGLKSTDPDVRRALAQFQRAPQNHRRPLHRACQTKVCRGGAPLPRAMPIRTGNSGGGL